MLCQCGCGQTTAITTHTHNSRGTRKGESARFVPSHNSLIRRRKISDQGYILILAPEHPMAHCDGYVLEHRLVMADKLGRPLRPNEPVHHINHIKTDNQPENLMLVDVHEHKRIHYPPASCTLCERKAHARGLCFRHYQSAYFREGRNPRQCSECDRPHLAKGLCYTHYWRSKGRIK